MDMELNEVVAAIKGKLSFKEFTERYFAVQEIDGKFFNIEREELKYRTAVEFYDDYISSGREFNQYVKETSFEA